MKKIFTLIASLLLVGGGSLFAQTDVIELSWDTMVKNETGDNAADQANTEFWADEATGTKTGFILTREDGSARTQAKTEREYCGKVLNAQNNKVQKLVIPAGTKVYKINFYGWSQGDNWTYLYAYGPSSAEYEWTDPIGSGVQDNNTIIDNAKYPLDPCVINESGAKAGSTAYHNAGYCFASIDFSSEPYEGEFCFVFNGNNQERYWMVVYTSEEAAKAAPAAEAVKIGKENSVKTFIEEGEAAAAAEEAAKHEIVGAEDNTAGWWSAFSSYQTIPADKTLHIEFTNYSSKANNWNNWLCVVTNNIERGVEGYNEYCVLRADNYAWQYGLNTGPDSDHSWFTSLTSNYNWDTFKDDMDGSKVVLEVIRVGAAVTIHADITATSGNTYFEEFVINCGDGTQDVGVFLTTEQGHLDIYKPSISIFDSVTTGVENLTIAQPAKTAAIYNMAGQRVDSNYKGLVIKNGKKYIVK